MRIQRVLSVAAGLLPSCLLGGCRKPVYFPLAPLAGEGPATRAFDVDGDGRAEFFQHLGPNGRVRRIAYDRDKDGKADETVDLDAVAFADCRHLVIILDGFACHLVREVYDAGGLRMFHPPSRVVAPYPTLTDLALADALDTPRCRGFEAMHYNRQAGKLVGGSGAYLAGKNAPYASRLHHRAGMLWDALGYLYPWEIFGKELNDAKRLFDRGKTREMVAYFVSSAGVGTILGADGQRRALKRVEQFVNQIVWETRGRTKVTLLSDHGQSYTPGTRIQLAPHLRGLGWRLVDRLRKPHDVVFVRFGLETYASFATDSPEDLAKDLVAAEGVELASFASDGAVVVLARDGARAVVREQGGRFRYDPLTGDPLGLREALSGLGADAEGYYDADALLEATIAHQYPAPLQRLWRAHFDLVDRPPDVIVSLADRFYSGQASLARRVSIASTHGSLNATNSVAFIMSTAGELPPTMRSRDIPKNLRRLTGEPFPLGK